jgi:hypothetical protein
MYLYIIIFLLIVFLANKLGPYQVVDNKIVRKGREAGAPMFGGTACAGTGTYKEGFFFGTRGTFKVDSEDVKNNIGHADASGNIADPSFWAIFNIVYTVASNVSHFIIKVPYDIIIRISHVVMDSLMWFAEMFSGAMDVALISLGSISKIAFASMKRLKKFIIEMFAMVRNMPRKIKEYSNSL